MKGLCGAYKGLCLVLVGQKQKTRLDRARFVIEVGPQSSGKFREQIYRALITPHDQYRRLARTDTERREAYRALFRAHVDEALTDEIRSATNGNYALGGLKFQKQIEKALGRRVSRGVAGRPIKSEDADDRQLELL